MKIYEKMILMFFLLSLCFKIFDIPGSIIFYSFSSILMISSYFFGGYLMFNFDNPKKYLLPIFSGIAIATSFIALKWCFSLNIDKTTYWFLVPNEVLFILLGIYLFLKRKTGIKSLPKGLFNRSLVLLLLTSFFAYIPITFRPTRKILYILNNDNLKRQNNLLMFDYSQFYDEAKEAGDFDKEIEYALKSNKAGKDWLGINDSNEKKSDKLYKIEGVYENVYFAYKDKGNQCANNYQYTKALEYYKKANNYFTLFHTNIKEQSFSYANMAYCYKKMKNYKIADSLYLLAINKYETIGKSPDYNHARLINEFANSLSNQMQFNASNLLYKVGNTILEKNLSVKKNKEELICSYNDMIQNYLKEDSLGNALYYIKKGLQLNLGKTNSDFIITNSLYGTYFFKSSNYKKAEYYVTKSIKSFESINESNSIDTANCYLMLGYINCASAKYSDARKNLNRGITIIEKKFGSQNLLHLSFLLALANLNNIEGNYLKSEKQYNEVFTSYTNKFGSENNKLIAPLIGLSSMGITLSKFTLAKEFSDRASSIVKKNGLPPSPKITEVINNDAYIDYCMNSYKSSELSYRKTIKINNNFSLQKSVTSAIAFNGLGLIAMKQNNYSKADSLFTTSLQLHKNIFTEQNPLTATVHLNIGKLNILQVKLKDAEENIKKSMAINSKLLNHDHSVFGDIYFALGDLEKKKNNKDISNDYYKKALAIYTKNFDQKHWKIIATKQKLN